MVRDTVKKKNNGHFSTQWTIFSFIYADVKRPVNSGHFCPTNRIDNKDVRWSFNEVLSSTGAYCRPIFADNFTNKGNYKWL